MATFRNEYEVRHSVFCLSCSLGYLPFPDILVKAVLLETSQKGRSGSGDLAPNVPPLPTRFQQVPPTLNGHSCSRLKVPFLTREGRKPTELKGIHIVPSLSAPPPSLAAASPAPLAALRPPATCGHVPGLSGAMENVSISPQLPLVETDGLAGKTRICRKQENLLESESRCKKNLANI